MASTGQEAGIGASFRYLADQHLNNPGKINRYAVKDHFTRTTQSPQWGQIGQQLARMLNNPPHQDDQKPIRELVGQMGFDHAVRALSNNSDKDSHEIHQEYEAIERARQKAFEPVAALIDSSEWAHEDKDTFYQDAYRVADMIHGLHVDENRQSEVRALEAHKMSSMELQNYQSAVPIGEPADMVGIKWRKTGANVVRGFRKAVGKGKEKVTKQFGGKGAAQQPLKVLRNANTLTAKVYLEKGQIRQVVFAAEGKSDMSATAADESSNYYKMLADAMKEFGVRAYYFDGDTISSFFPRNIQRMWLKGNISSLNQGVNKSGSTSLDFQATDWSFSSLGYFEDFRSEYPLGQACIWKLDGADVPERDSSAEEQKSIRVLAGNALTCSVTVMNEFEHVIYNFSAATTNFRGDKKIGDEWSQSQKIYRVAVKNKATDLHQHESPMRDAWKDGNVRVLQFDLDKTKPVSGPSMLGEAGDYKTVTPRLLLFCGYRAGVRSRQSARRTMDIIRPTYAVLMIPTITRVNHKVARIPRK